MGMGGGEFKVNSLGSAPQPHWDEVNLLCTAPLPPPSLQAFVQHSLVINIDIHPQLVVCHQRKGWEWHPVGSPGSIPGTGIIFVIIVPLGIIFLQRLTLTAASSSSCRIS
jgi:hypothetical protein